ncbi:MAG: class I SAM-dependent methyltransferase [Actinobacteria bacterium]|nr:class I SAM-dependent methyltransferase [Actinomycetota bacterium]
MNNPSDKPGSIQHLPYTHPDVISIFENATVHAMIMSAVKDSVKPGGTVLDVGSGRGELMSQLAMNGYDVSGCDLDDECLRLSSRYGPVTRVDIEDIQSGSFDQKFDCIIMSHVLEHLENPRETLGRLAGFTNGLMIISVPNPSYLQFIARSLVRAKIDYVNVRHLCCWDWYHFKTLIEMACGFKILDYYYDSVALPAPAPVRRWLYRRGWLEPIENHFLKKLLPRFCRSVTAVIRVVPE